MNTTRKNTWNNTCRTTTGTTRGTWTPTNYYTTNSPKFNPIKNECQWRMGSYNNVYSQFSGNTKTAFSPTIANRWMRYVNNGNRVYKFNTNEFTRYFGRQWNTTSPTTTRNYLQRKFGTFIKDVTRGTNNCWLIATTKNVAGRPFNNYTW